MALWYFILHSALQNFWRLLWQVGSNSFPHHWHLCSVPIPYILRFSSSLLHYTAFFFSCVGSYLFFAYTQITFSNRRVFACVSLMRVKRKAELPDPYIVVTLGLPYPLESRRVAAKTEPYPGRWTTHFVIGSTGELDQEFFAWVREAYDFSAAKWKS
ncbi:DUF5655 domain-containing protein [Acutalibacter muris]|uniref:DUF5655 domain-containing protein n=1 Tax=Acutalibacter muris TaxID=1796620 RepID=UPI002E8E4F96|nr:DUF5655 domain-containing protein [Acutalibacter muris]